MSAVRNKLRVVSRLAVCPAACIAVRHNFSAAFVFWYPERGCRGPADASLKQRRSLHPRANTGFSGTQPRSRARTADLRPTRVDAQVSAITEIFECPQKGREIRHPAPQRHLIAAAAGQIVDRVPRMNVQNVPPQGRDCLDRRMTVHDQVAGVESHAQRTVGQCGSSRARSSPLSLPVSAANVAPMLLPIRSQIRRAPESELANPGRRPTPARVPPGSQPTRTPAHGPSAGHLWSLPPGGRVLRPRYTRAAYESRSLPPADPVPRAACETAGARLRQLVRAATRRGHRSRPPPPPAVRRPAATRFSGIRKLRSCTAIFNGGIPGILACCQ